MARRARRESVDEATVIAKPDPDTPTQSPRGHKSHVNLISLGPPARSSTPTAASKAREKGRHLTLRSVDELPRQAVRGCLRTAVKIARAKT
jgi:hypothetical protein